MRVISKEEEKDNPSKNEAKKIRRTSRHKEEYYLTRWQRGRQSPACPHETSFLRGENRRVVQKGL